MSNHDVRPLVRKPLPAPRREVLCEVTVESEVFGACRALVRNVNRVGAFLEMCDPLPLGAEILVRFGEGVDSMVVRARVQQHHAHNFTTRGEPDALEGMVVRFLGFAPGEEADRSLH